MHIDKEKQNLKCSSSFIEEYKNKYRGISDGFLFQLFILKYNINGFVRCSIPYNHYVGIFIDAYYGTLRSRKLQCVQNKFVTNRKILLLLSSIYQRDRIKMNIRSNYYINAIF